MHVYVLGAHTHGQRSVTLPAFISFNSINKSFGDNFNLFDHVSQIFPMAWAMNSFC